MATSWGFAWTQSDLIKVTDKFRLYELDPFHIDIYHTKFQFWLASWFGAEWGNNDRIK